MKYFKDCKSLDEARVLYKKLSFKLHPDVSGEDTTAAFQEMQNQFENFKPETEKFEGESAKFNSKDFMDLMEQLRNIPSVEIEVCGSWVWLTSDKSAKEEIKAIEIESYKRGWHKKKVRWYFRPADYKRKFKKGEFSMDEIRNKYGSKTFKGNERKKIA